MNQVAQQSLVVSIPECPRAALSPEAAPDIAAQMPDTAPGPYYVSVMREGGDWRLVSGPYPQHAIALELISKARRICEDMDPKSCWYAFGTVRMAEDCDTPGILQKSGYDLALERRAA